MVSKHSILSKTSNRLAILSLLILLSTVESRAEVRESDESRVGYARNELETSLAPNSTWRKSEDTKFAYRIGSGFDSFVNEREQSQFYGLGLGGDFRAQLLSNLSFRAKAGVNLSNGYAQSRWGDNVGVSGFVIDEAALSYRLMDSNVARFYLAGGALGQDSFGAPLFISKVAFPGVRENLVLGSNKEFSLRIWAQQVIPTSKTLSTKTVDAEVTPSLMTETVEMTIAPHESIEAKASLTHFVFNNLPSAIATESVVYGNSVEEIGPNSSRFKYRFEGAMAKARVNIVLTSNFSWMAEGYVVQNAAAPEGYRNLQLVKSGFKIGLPGEIELLPSIGTFFVEDDAVPGFYNSSEIGHNNRKGFAAGIEAYFQRQRFKLRANFADSDVINFNINQSRQQTLTIGFETFYEML